MQYLSVDKLVNKSKKQESGVKENVIAVEMDEIKVS